MPMKSKAQRGYLWAKHPDIAQKFENETAEGAKLPEYAEGEGKKPKPAGLLVRKRKKPKAY